MLGDPVGEALGEGEVVERGGESGDFAGDFDDFVDIAGVAGLTDAPEADVEGRQLGVLEPGAPKEVAALDAEGGDGGGSGEDGLLHLGGECGGEALVGVEDEDPGVAEGELQSGVALAGVAVEGAGGDGGAVLAGDVGGAVGAFGVEDVDVVAPGDGGEAAGEILLFVFGEDEDGDHAASPGVAAG